MRDTRGTVVTVLAAVAGATAVLFGAGGQDVAHGRTLTTVTLEKRTTNGAYGRSAYSFRYGSQAEEVHENRVDLVFNGCGLLHVSPHKGLSNRIARVDAARVDDVTAIPSEGWVTKCIKPERGAIYFVDVDDGIIRTRVVIRITDLTESTLTFEWVPFRHGKSGRPGTLGQCGGQHECT